MGERKGDAPIDRLEAFLMKAGGPLARALDSRSFTQALFESDTDVADLVTKWGYGHRSGPGTPSRASRGGFGSIARCFSSRASS